MLIDIIKSRRSIRKFTDKQILKEDLMYVLDAGRLAPSGGNEQPWIFGIIDDRELINELARYSNNQRWIANAPVVIALCTKRMSDEDMDVEKYRLGKLKEDLYDIDPNVFDIICAHEHQALIAAQNMTLTAWEKGIGSCIIAYLDVYKASKLLKVPNSHLVTYLLALGYPDIESTPKNLKSLDEIIFYNKYDK